MDAENAQERQEGPGEGVIDGTGLIVEVGPPSRAGNQKQVDDPADQQQAAREEPDRAGDWLSKVEAVSAQESEKPEDVADQD